MSQDRVMHFATRERLLRHVSDKRKRCFLFYTRHVPDTDPDVIADLQRQRVIDTRAIRASGHRADYAARAAFRLQGPLTWQFMLVGISHTTRTQFELHVNLRIIRSVGSVANAGPVQSMISEWSAIDSFQCLDFNILET